MTRPYRVTRYLVCPDCAKKGVTLRTTSSEDWYVCRYCEWSACNEGEDDPDVRRRGLLAQANPEADVWVTARCLCMTEPDPLDPEGPERVLTHSTTCREHPEY